VSKRRIYVIRNPGGLPRNGNGVAMRPSGFPIFQDGSWVLTGLSWSGWGSPVARATGTSDASNGMPDQADGARLRVPARITLSNPGPYRGHEVYRCFRLTFPPPATSGHGCLTHVRGISVMSDWG
jgi:hypothetical protein